MKVKLKLFFEWGIEFGKPYQVPDKGSMGGFAVGGEAAKNRELRVIYYNFSALFAIVLLKLPKRLYYRHDAQTAGTAGREHHLCRLLLKHSAARSPRCFW